MNRFAMRRRSALSTRRPPRQLSNAFYSLRIALQRSTPLLGVTFFATVYSRHPERWRGAFERWRGASMSVRFVPRNLFRACGTVAALACWYAITMRDASANTSREHHPYGGPFVLLKQSRGAFDFLISGAVALSIGVPAVLLCVVVLLGRSFWELRPLWCRSGCRGSVRALPPFWR